MNILTGQNKLLVRHQESGSDVQPVTLDMLKEHIQVTHSYDDSVIGDLGGYLPAAVEEVENRGNVALIEQTRRQTISFDIIDEGVCGAEIALVRGPIVSVDQVAYLDSDGAQQILAPANYRLTPDGTIYFLENPPTLADGPRTVWIDYTAGYGQAANDVPSQWRSIIMIIACRLYDFRGGDSGSSNDSWERMIQRKVDIAGGLLRGY